MPSPEALRRTTQIILTRVTSKMTSSFSPSWSSILVVWRPVAQWPPKDILSRGGWAEELVLARNCVKEVLLPRLRPDLPTTYRNRHFHSAEALETIFMRQVLQEVQQRCFAVSTIWLHDGFWICSSVRDDIIREAEKAALNHLFPASCQGERILRIKSLNRGSWNG